MSKESALKSEKYSYNSQNLICESVVIDRENKTQSVSYYGYDAFGRRVVVQDKDAACMRNLYDGFTFDVIKQSPTLANGMFVDSNETGIRLNRTGKATGDRYRYLDDDKNDGNRYFYLDEGTYKSVTSRYVGERTSITVNGVVAAQNAGGEVSYFTTDLLGSVRSTTDSTGFGTNAYLYDVFGSLVEGDLNGAADYGYLGKQFDAQTGLYNYGYRDYAPGVARFTTVDPIRDGENWFAYVNNDPVNFVDLWGLSASDADMAGVPPQYRKALQDQKEKHKNDDVRPDTPYNQLSPELSDIYGMKEGGCYFMDTLFVAQDSTGKNLTANEIKTIVNQSKINGSLGNDLTVNNPDKTTNKAFAILGADKTATYNWNQEIVDGLPQTPDYVIGKGTTVNNNYHYTVLFDYDPYPNTYSYKPDSKTKIIPVYLHEGK